MSTLSNAIATAKDLRRRAGELALRIAAIHEQYGVILLVGRVLRDPPGRPRERQPETERPREEISSAEVREFLQIFTELQQEVANLQVQVPALQEATWSDSLYAAASLGIEADLNRLTLEMQMLARSAALQLEGYGEFQTLPPALWSEQTVDRLTESLVGLSAYLESGRLAIDRREARPGQTPTEGIIPASELPWPVGEIALRNELTYSQERHGTPEQYLNMLASRIRTPEQFNDFLRIMFRYDYDFNQNGQQQILNLQRIERDQLWHDPATFLTTYNADGRLTGDCKSVALALKEILRRQGRDVVALEANNIQPPDSSGRVDADGHMATIWVETVDGRLVAHRLDTTEQAGADGSVLSITANPGETREQLIVRAFNTGENRVLLDPERLGLCARCANGWAIDLPATVGLLPQAKALEQAIETGRYDDAIGILRAEIGRNATNLNLRLAELQMYLLKRASAAELEPLIVTIEGLTTANAESRTTPANFYFTRATVSILRKEGHEALARRLQDACLRR